MYNSPGIRAYLRALSPTNRCLKVLSEGRYQKKIPMVKIKPQGGYTPHSASRQSCSQTVRMRVGSDKLQNGNTPSPTRQSGADQECEDKLSTKASFFTSRITHTSLHAESN